jgi:quercetin dioxygenase-like cupin family protein
VRIIDRDSLDGISSAVVDGVVHHLGLVKDFHKNPVLDDFIAGATRLSLSWVRLRPGEELAVHQHPTKSMIIVAQGDGLVNGDLSGPISSGDVVVVPSDARHGFVGADPAGFWALSLQFEGSGLYENPESPRVAFAGPDQLAGSDSDVDLVRAANQRHIDTYRRGALVSLLQDLDRQPESVRERLLDFLQSWSDAFQRVVTARVVAETDVGSRLLAQQHLAEELGHNRLLDQARAGRPARRDPVIAAVSSWFIDRMSFASSVERTVLAHLVLEGSGMVFHAAALTAFGDGEYVRRHDGAEAEHLDLGYRALATQRDWSVDEVLAILRDGWQMMTLLSDRLAECGRQA